MADLTPDDVRRWDPAAVLKVFQVANGRADTMQRFGDDLGQVGQGLADWEGEAGTAFHTSLGRARTDIEADGRESAQVASAVSNAWEDVQITKGMMSEVDGTASGLGFTITKDWKVDIGTAGLLMGPTEAQLEQQVLQSELDTVKTKAHTTDHELATAMRGAVGDAKLDQNGREVPQAPAPGDGKTTLADQLRCRRRAATHRFPPRRRRTTARPTSAITCRTTLIFAAAGRVERRRMARATGALQARAIPCRTHGHRPAIRPSTLFWHSLRDNRTRPTRGEPTRRRTARRRVTETPVRAPTRTTTGTATATTVAAWSATPSSKALESMLVRAPTRSTATRTSPRPVPGTEQRRYREGTTRRCPVFRPDPNSGTEHTGIYIGNGYMMNATDSGNPVRVDPVAGPTGTDSSRMP